MDKETRNDLPGIQWFPGHMKKAQRLIEENLKLVDVVVEVVDARIPASSRNPLIHEIIGNKPLIIALNKKDLADDEMSRLWRDHFKQENAEAILINSNSGEGTKELMKILGKMSAQRQPSQAKRPLRLMIVGVPNVGKSSLINRLSGRKSTQTGDRPGVTKGKQWIKLSDGIQLLDTPGILWPKFEDPSTGKNLAFCGSIKDEVMDVPTLGMELIGYLAENYPDLLKERYKMEEILETPLENMEDIAGRRGCILPGKRIDYERTGRMVLDEFRAGTIGRITLEKP